MDVRPLEPSDAAALADFLSRIPEEDSTFFKEDVRDPGIVDEWVGDRRGRRLVCLKDGGILGYVGVLPGIGWSGHVGELRLVVDQEHRRQGIGRELARRGLAEALGMGLRKIVVEVVADSEPAIAMFQAIGFQPEALLRDHVRDRRGDYRDLLLLAHSVEDTWESLAATGIDDAAR